MHNDYRRTPGPARARGLITAQETSRLERALGPYASLLGNRPLSLLVAAHALSAFIDWLYVVALFIVAYGLTHSATVVALLTFARLLPYAVLLPFSGTITDRADRRVLMIVANLGRALAILGLTLVQSRSTLPLAFVLVFMTTILASLFRPALLATVPTIVAERKLIQANSVLGQVDMAAFGGGPALAALIVLLANARVALIVAAAGLAVSALCVWACRLPAGIERPLESAGPTSTAQGVRFLLRSHQGVLLGIAVAWSGLTLFGGAYWALSVVLADQSFHLGSAGAGFVNAAYAVGGLLGGFLVAPALSRLKPPTLFVVATAASSLAEIAFGLSPAGILPFLFFYATGLADALAKITATTMIQSATPRHLLGRIFGAFESIFILAMVIGSLVAGPLINALGPRLACALVAAGGLGLLAISLPLLARLDTVLGVRVFLFQVPVLNLLPFDLMDELVGRLREERYQPGTAIVRQGDQGDRMYLVKSGRVVVHLEGDGLEVPLAVLKRGDYFGEMALLQDAARSATCRALGVVEVYVVERSDFQELLGKSEEFGAAMRSESSARSAAAQGLYLLRG